MLPVDMEGRQYFLSGVRRSPADAFQCLHIPVGPDGRIERVQAVARSSAGQSVAATSSGDAVFADELTESMTRLVTLFTAKGFDGIAARVDATVPEAERSAVLDVCLKVLQTMLASLYTELLAENGVDLSQGISAQDGVFYDDAINAIGAVANYGSPFYIQLKSFEQIQSGGLQIACAPGKALVYIGFTLLIAGGPACSVFQQAVCAVCHYYCTDLPVL